MTIKSLVDDIRQSTDYQKNKIRLKEQVMGDLIVSHNSGLFVVTPDLIAFLSVWDDDLLYLEDHYGNPIQVNREELLTQCKQQYQKVMNRWHSQHAQLQTIRKI